MHRIAIFLLALVACDKQPEPTKEAPLATTPGAPAPKTPLPAELRNPKPEATAIAWKKPEAWKEVQHPSTMRKATYAIEKVEGDPEDAEMTVTQVGGSINANVKRWEDQFGGNDSTTEKKEVDGLEISIVTIEGTYSGGMGPMMGGDSTPKEDFALLAAVVPTEPAHFFKLTGPKKTVQAARADFDELVSSIAKK